MKYSYNNRQTDIADEIIEDNKKKMFQDGSSSYITKYLDDIVKHVVNLEKDNAYNRPKGRYVTIDSPLLIFGSKSVFEHTVEQLYTELKKQLINKKNILVVGIGNKGQTSDSLGPKVIQNIENHRVRNGGKLIFGGKRKLFAFAPNVAFRTGIDSVEITKSLVETIKPDIVIIIDSLCTSKIERIGTSFQIADSGLSPGSGLNDDSFELSKSTLGVDSVAIGVPMVVFASELAVDFLFNDLVETEIFKEKFRDKMKNSFGDFVVTPKDIDDIVYFCSEVISEAIVKVLYSKNLNKPPKKDS